jgi:hypothetical protein
MSRDHPPGRGTEERPRLDPKWYTVSQVAQLLGYGETKVRMLIISGDPIAKGWTLEASVAGVGRRLRPTPSVPS